ncbi:MAG: putative bifunctional diguanylate cyclase/phosphodiesterase [Beijerinckiaceae bacterium]
MLPFAVLLFAILGAVVLTVVAMAQRTSEASDERIRRLLTASLTEAVNDTARDLRTISELDRTIPTLASPDRSDQSLDSYLEQIRAMGDFEAVSLMNAKGQLTRTAVRLVYGKESPEQRYASSLNWAASELARKIARPGNSAQTADIVGRYMVENGELRYVAAILRRDANSRTALGLVASRSLGEEGISRLGNRLAIMNLRLVNQMDAKSPNQIMIPSVDDTTSTKLTWVSERPGDPILERLFPIALFSSLAISIFAWLSYAHVTRVTASMLNSEAKAQHLAGHDTLSGLPNRLRFTEHLKSIMSRLDASEPGLAVLFIDLDKFKDVNDTYGHAAGDHVIRECAERMASQLRASDVLARFGGDEFAIIQTDIKSPTDSELLARRIIEVIRPAFHFGDAEAYIGASIGIALAPSNATEASELMRLADIAMYRAKNSGRNRACFFEQRMDDSLRIRKVVEDDLRHAIDRDQLELHYQPQVSADGSRIVGIEALVRWRHPTLGLIPPVEFISIAEERGLIVQLGEWVIRRACRDAANWGDVTVACNVSAIQFRQSDFVESVGQALKDTGFDPHRLELELTESVVVADADQAENSIMELRSMGVKLALDDFGTGYSSLIYLRRFAFDKIKLDKSFLDSLEDTGESAILVHSVVHLGRALGLTVTAEGVETVEQQRFLQAVGCHLIQGYLFSRPLPFEQMDALFKKNTPFQLEQKTS